VKESIEKGLVITDVIGVELALMGVATLPYISSAFLK